MVRFDGWKAKKRNQFETVSSFVRLNAWRGFDQCGAMYGQVTIENGNGVDKEIVEVNLPGVRRVRFDGETTVGENTTIVGAGDDGCIFSLSTDSEYI